MVTNGNPNTKRGRDRGMKRIIVWMFPRVECLAVLKKNILRKRFDILDGDETPATKHDLMSMVEDFNSKKHWWMRREGTWPA